VSNASRTLRPWRSDSREVGQLPRMQLSQISPPLTVATSTMTGRPAETSDRGTFAIHSSGICP